MNEKADDGEKFIECWDCGDIVPAGECKGLPFDKCMVSLDGTEYFEEDVYPVCDPCYRVWVSIMENTG